MAEPYEIVGEVRKTWRLTLWTWDEDAFYLPNECARMVKVLSSWATCEEAEKAKSEWKPVPEYHELRVTPILTWKLFQKTV